ncbi:unnamed protein product, partial [Brenthis ino]
MFEDSADAASGATKGSDVKYSNRQEQPNAAIECSTIPRRVELSPSRALQRNNWHKVKMGAHLKIKYEYLMAFPNSDE